MLYRNRIIKERTRPPETDRPGKTSGYHNYSARKAVRALCVIAAAALVFAFSGCGEKGNDWITSPESEDVSAANGIGGEPFEGQFSAPSFFPGTYIMTNDTVNSQTYTDVNGKLVYSGSMLTRYIYTLDISVDETITCRYTFKSIYGSSTADGQSSVEVDTSDQSLRNDGNAVFYDLIGRSFTVTADKNADITGINGVDGILSEVSGADRLIDEELLYNMAEDLFYVMPDTLGYGTSWKRNQYGIENTYTVDRLSRGMLGVSIKGGSAGLPEPVRDDEGYTTTYLSVDNITGSLWLDQTDRAVQEISTAQKSRGTIADDNMSGVYFDFVSTTSTKIEKAP